LTFNNNTDEYIIEKIKEKWNFKLDIKLEVAQGIVFPQDFLNKKNQAILGSSFNVGDGVFALNEYEKSSLNLDELESQLIKPYYTTEQIQRYYSDSKNSLWLIYTDSIYKNEENMKIYPNLKKHLDKFRNIITSDNKPYGLHRSRDERFFRGEKIIALRKCVCKPSFSYSFFDSYVSATFYVIKTDRLDQKFLLGLLNSKLFEFWLRKKGKMQGDNFQIDKQPILEMPIYCPLDKSQLSLIELVDQILISKKGNNKIDTIAFEKQIDNLVYKLYELTYDEIKVIDPEFSLTEAEYNSITLE
jgi:adenine-specific DNA-methyltransferase